MDAIETREPNRPNQNTRLELFRQPGLLILAMALFGVLVATALSILMYWAAVGLDQEALKLLASAPWLLVSGAGAAPAVLLTWYWRTTTRFKELETTTRQIALDERKFTESQHTDRFAEAARLLAAESESVQLAGVFSMESLAIHSETYKSAIGNLLVAFVVDAVPKRMTELEGPALFDGLELYSNSTAVVQGTLTVLGGEALRSEQPPIRLFNAVLSGLQFIESSFFLDLKECYVQDSRFWGATLELSEISRSQFHGCCFMEANLASATATATNFFGCTFLNATLDKGTFSESAFGGVPVGGFVGASFVGADLRNSSFYGDSDLTGLDLSGADLCGASFSEVQGLESAVLKGAEIDESTSFPPGFDCIAAGVILVSL